MTQTLRLTLLSTTLATFALGQPKTDSGITRAEPVIVEETRLTADAAGTTLVRFDDTAPPATQSLESLASRVANLHVAAGGANSYGDLFTLRGLANTPYFSDPSVALYFDDIPLGSSFTYPTGLFGFASATITRGPQGSAFGRGGEGGVITLSSIEPGATAASELRSAAGNFNLRSAALSARSARGGFADASVALSFLQRDGYISNTTLGRPVDDQQASAASARVRVRPTAASEFTFQFLGSKHHDGAQPLVPLGGPLFSVVRARDGSTNIDFGAAAIKGAFATPLGQLIATTSYTDWSLNPYDNRLTLPPTLDSKILQIQRTWNEEIRLASDARAAIAWHAGAWWSDSKTTGDVNRGLVIGAPTNIPIEVSSYSLTARTAALFGDATITPAAGWRVTLALRAEEAKKDFDRSQRVPGAGHFTDAKAFDSFAPKLSASRALSADTTASASVSLGTKPGGWSAYTGNAALAPFKQERATAFEAGVDTALANKTVKLAVRVFDYEIDNYQIERSFNASDYLVVNAPRARSLGGELEATWRPIAEWTLAATLGFTDVTLREFTDPFTNKNLSGNRAPYAPIYNGHLSATWRGAGGWFAAAEFAATGKTFFDESENPAFAARAYLVTNARFGYETPRWRATFYGENLGDTQYAALIIPGVRHVSPGAPRTYGIELTAKF